MFQLEWWLDPYVRPVVRLIPARRVVINRASNPRWMSLPNIVVAGSVSWWSEGKVPSGGKVTTLNARYTSSQKNVCLAET